MLMKYLYCDRGMSVIEVVIYYKIGKEKLFMWNINGWILGVVIKVYYLILIVN